MDPATWQQISDAIRGLVTNVGVFLAGRHGFSVNYPSLPVCHTQVVRAGRGFPWNEQIAIHRMKDGRLDISPLRLPHK